MFVGLLKCPKGRLEDEWHGIILCYLPAVKAEREREKISLVPRPLSEGVWQHVLHCGVQKVFNQLLNHVLMFTRASGN